MKIIRKNERYYKKTSVKIYIDGNYIGATEGKQQTDINLKKGTHEVYFKIPLMRSKTIEVTNDDELTISCGRAGSMWIVSQLLTFLVLFIGVFGVYIGIPEIVSIIACGVYIAGMIVWMMVFFTKIAPNAIKVIKKKN